jgi:hypothetical protein
MSRLRFVAHYSLFLILPPLSMKTWLIILTLVVFGFIIYFAYTWTRGDDASGLVRACPDELIINKMPGTQPQSSYYIIDGVRREISEFDTQWIGDNCNVPTQEVY